MSEGETDDTDTTVAAVADAIRAVHTVPPLSDEERLQRQIDNEIWHEQRWRAEQQRAAYERKQAEAAEQARREATERQRQADEARRQKRRAELAQREAENRLNQRLRSNDLKWAQLEQSVALAQRQQMQRAYLQHFDGVLNEAANFFNPPPPPLPPETEIVYVSEEERGTGRLGYSDFNPRLMARPHRWW